MIFLEEFKVWIIPKANSFRHLGANLITSSLLLPKTFPLRSTDFSLLQACYMLRLTKERQRSGKPFSRLSICRFWNTTNASSMRSWFNAINKQKLTLRSTEQQKIGLPSKMNGLSFSISFFEHHPSQQQQLPICWSTYRRVAISNRGYY